MIEKRYQSGVGGLGVAINGSPEVAEEDTCE